MSDTRQEQATGTEPAGTEPTAAGTGPAGAAGTGPAGTAGTAGTEPTGTEPTGTEPTGTEPTGTGPAGTEPAGTAGTEPADADTFGREYVEALRSEAAEHRRRARDQFDRAETLRRDLYRERVAALHILADPGDLPYDPAVLDDIDQMAAAARAIVAERPHLAATGAHGYAWQDHGAADTGAISLTGMLRARA